MGTSSLVVKPHVHGVSLLSAGISVGIGYHVRQGTGSSHKLSLRRPMLSEFGGVFSLDRSRLFRLRGSQRCYRSLLWNINGTFATELQAVCYDYLSCLERFSRTVQEQFIYCHIDYLDDTLQFNWKLMEYLIWYNTERAQRSIGNIPLRYYIDKFLIPSQKSNMLWTLTAY
jgi:hypothetical protein